MKILVRSSCGDETHFGLRNMGEHRDEDYHRLDIEGVPREKRLRMTMKLSAGGFDFETSDDSDRYKGGSVLQADGTFTGTVESLNGQRINGRLTGKLRTSGGAYVFERAEWGQGPGGGARRLYPWHFEGREE